MPRREGLHRGPPLLIEGVAGLALLPALGGALTTALSDTRYREPATAAFVTTASGITVAGTGAPFWGLLVGLALLAASQFRQRHMNNA